MVSFKEALSLKRCAESEKSSPVYSTQAILSILVTNQIFGQKYDFHQKHLFLLISDKPISM